MRYSIEGEPLPVVIVNLEKGESVITEKGAMSWMSGNLSMETFAGKAGSAFGRMFSGESIFLNRYTADAADQMIAFASSFPGSIRAVEVKNGRGIVAQKKSFLAASEGVQLSVFFQKKASVGFFGGEGFIMQQISGEGIAFLEFDGYVKEYELAAGEKLIVDSGYLAACDSTCSIDIEAVKGIKNKLLGGEGLFNTYITGPGKVYVQSMPIYQTAQRIAPYIPGKS